MKQGNGFDPVDQEIAEVRQKLIDRGADSFTEKDWQFLLAHQTFERIRQMGESMETLASAIVAHIEDPQPNGKRTKRQAIVHYGIPTTIVAGIMALLTQLIILGNSL